MEQHRIGAMWTKSGPAGPQVERRRHPRLRCKGIAEIRLISAEITIPGTLLDLSLSGCCIQTSTPLPPNDPPYVEVHLHVRGTTLRVAGIVRHIKRESRAGIEFIDMTARKTEQIRELIKEWLKMEIEHDSFVSARQAAEVLKDA